MGELVSEPGIAEIQKGATLLGLKLSEFELSKLAAGDPVFLESRSLSEIGSAFILADALSALHTVKGITLQELSEFTIGSSYCPGVPIYFWQPDYIEKCCLLLAMLNGKPAVQVVVTHQNSDVED